MADLPSFLNFTRKRRGGIEHTGDEPVPLGGRDNSDGPKFLPGATTPTNAAPPPTPRVNPALDLDPSAAVVPEAPEAVALPMAVGPEVTGEQRRKMGLAPLPVNANGETVGKPQYDDTGNRGADLENYRRGLADQRNPEDRDGRWWTALKEAGRGLLEGGLMGAAARGLRGAVAPNVNERRQRDREIQRVEGEQAKDFQQQTWQQKLAEAQADIELKNANAEYTRQRPAIEADRNDVRTDIAREGFETRRAIAGMQDATKRSEGDKNRAVKLTAAEMLDKFKRTKLYEDIKRYAADRKSREGIAANAQAGADRRTAAAQAGADRRTAATQAGADRRTLTGMKFKLMNLAIQAEKENKTLEEVINEVQTHGGEVLPDEK